jgi:serine/threonine protein phosphatase PrpC
MGGAAAGEVASRLAARVVFEQLARSPSGADAAGFRDALSAAVVQAGEAIRRHATENPANEGMGTTCTVAAVRGGLLLIAQVGDSRAYLMRGGELRQLTTDQTWANEMLARGRVSPEQAAAMENGKAITQALGTSEAIEVEVIALELWQGDRILICSDGLSGMVPDSDLGRVLTTGAELEPASDELLRLALERGGRDNISFVLCEFGGTVLKTPSEAEPEYRLPIRRGPEQAAMVVFVLAVLGATLWHISDGGANDQVRSRAVRATPSTDAPHRAKSGVQAARLQAPSSDGVLPIEKEPSRPVTTAAVEGEADGAASPHGSVARRSSERRRGRALAGRPPSQRGEQRVKIERPREEEIRIIREDDPVASSPF